MAGRFVPKAKRAEIAFLQRRSGIGFGVMQPLLAKHFDEIAVMIARAAFAVIARRVQIFGIALADIVARFQIEQIAAGGIARHHSGMPQQPGFETAVLHQHMPGRRLRAGAFQNPAADFAEFVPGRHILGVDADEQVIDGAVPGDFLERGVDHVKVLRIAVARHDEEMPACQVLDSIGLLQSAKGVGNPARIGFLFGAAAFDQKIQIHRMPSSYSGRLIS
ncbi:MAG: hypothetical protein BWZ10_02766 [candidate division BRC1 bacterium ADurb.BinA364]|nr:MAG: hypothetical protein BWZ10_02766 [candidate division BRC1 bacterium ADurb.BinA364]